MVEKGGSLLEIDIIRHGQKEPTAENGTESSSYSWIHG